MRESKIVAILLVILLCGVFVLPSVAVAQEADGEENTQEQEEESNSAEQEESNPAEGTVSDVNVDVDDSGNLIMSGLDGSVGDFFEKYKKIIAIVAGVATMTMLLFFIKSFIQLGASTGNPNVRREAITGLLLTGLATTGLGMLTFIMGFFYNAFR